MLICPKCGYRDNPLWRHSRFDFNADYMRFEEAIKQPELKEITDLLAMDISLKFTTGGYYYYRRGKGKIWLYRVPEEDYKVETEKLKPKKKKDRTLNDILKAM